MQNKNIIFGTLRLFKVVIPVYYVTKTLIMILERSSLNVEQAVKLGFRMLLFVPYTHTF